MMIIGRGRAKNIPSSFFSTRVTTEAFIIFSNLE